MSTATQIRREGLTADAVRGFQAVLREKLPEWQFPSPEDVDANRLTLLSELPVDSDLWFFAYGSMMYNPAADIAESRKAALRGYRRSFNCEAPFARGSPESPGLMLAIEPAQDAVCQGLALRIEAAKVDDETRAIFFREMIAGFYKAVWVDCTLDGGETVRCLTVVADPTHDGVVFLSPDEKAARIAKAKGMLGTNREYLYKIRAELAKLGIADAYMDDLFKRWWPSRAKLTGL
ncbi:ChaC-like protein-domain-containing protein [Hyaloraphidium curvatum]|nr:ChaC-like protein-domain-containing protein [Hyaloraphidium curvatum]